MCLENIMASARSKPFFSVSAAFTKRCQSSSAGCWFEAGAFLNQ
jgi:hypothetical protein